jgi:purine-binding chemotaxis protein CheW
METKDIKIKTNSYLTFKLGDETFGTNVSNVLSILELSKITKVPKAPDYMVGVINLRGSVLPIVDTRVKFEMQSYKATTDTCILVLDVTIDNEKINVGIIVDNVQEVLEIPDNKVKPAPNIGSKYRSEFIEGVVHLNDEFIMLLNMDMIFSTHDLSILSNSVEVADKEKIEEIQ